MRSSAEFCLKNKNRIKLLYLTGVLLLLVAIVSGIGLGSTSVSFSELYHAICEGLYTLPAWRIIYYVRLPRTIASLVCGAALAVSGALIQGVLSNRLASPSVIGVNSGAGLAVTLCTAFGIYGGWRLSLFAFLGAFAAVMIVSLGARRWSASRGKVILIGVAMNSLLGAVSDTVVTFIPDVGMMSNDFKVGEFSAVTYQKLVPATVLILITTALLLTLANELDVLSLGEENAKGLGMNTELMNMFFLLLAALLAGCAVSLAGLLSFVGLLVPHTVRRLAGNRAFHLISLCALFGGAFVCLCDTVARCAFSPYEIPVGIIMAFLGAPFFIFILVRGRGGHKSD